MQAAQIITCKNCGTKNRVASENPNLKAKCGRCHQPLQAAAAEENNILTIRCSECRAKNRVPQSRLNAAPKCGRCGTPLQHTDILAGRPVQVTDANFNETVLRSPLPVLLYSWSPSCSICTSTTPMVSQLTFETRGKIRVGRLNTNANPGLATQYNILSVPSFFIFDAGQLKDHIAGAADKHYLMMKMATHLY